MKILWITISPLPEAMASVTGKFELKSSGGWIIGASNALLKVPEVELHVASVTNVVSELKIVKGEYITHYMIPKGKGNLKYNKEYESYWREINSNVKPDVVHIHGTEFTHFLSYVRACGNSNVVVSIQGLKWVYYRYYLGGLSFKDVFKSITLHDILRGTMYSRKNEFGETGKCEIELLKNVKYAIGRTDWDKAHIWAVNPECRYFFGNETLRDEFYSSRKWKYDNCVKHTIFLSQSYYPVKGLHKVLEAMPLVLRHYPDTQIRVAGTDVTKSDDFYSFTHYIGYGKYLKKQIQNLGLSDKITFLGPLNAQEMVDEYLRSNLFICPSSIENSPNSLGEAQILGVPHISSYVGGSMNLMKGNEDNLYRFEEVEMLAYKICKIFENSNNSHNMIEEASKRHSQTENANCLLKIYETILKDNSRM